MKRIMFLILFIGLLAGANHGFAKLFDLSLELSPTSEGQLEGYAAVDVNWWKYLNSSVQYESSSYNIFHENATDTRNMQNIEKYLYFYFIGTRDSLSQDLLGIDWLSINLGLVGKRAVIDQYEYGMIFISNSYTFFQDYTETTYFKPLIGAGLQLNFSIFELYSSVLFTPLLVNENYAGYFANSDTSNKEQFESKDTGFETDLYVGLTGDFGDILDVTLGFQYFTHTGRTSGRAGKERADFIYTRTDMSFSVLFGLKFLEKISDAIEVIPVVGATYITHSFEPENPNVESRSDSRWQLNIGLEL